jgi:hypothetical protein
VPATPGAVETLRIEGLASGTGYGLAVRARDRAGLLAALSNPLFARTTADSLETPPDSTGTPPDSTGTPPDSTAAPDPPPAPILDLAVVARDFSSVALRWTDTGEDSLLGIAAACELRFLEGAPIASAADWNAARPIPEGPVPDSAGTLREWTWSGIEAALAGGVAVRARDAAGQWSALAGGAWIPPYAPVPPPELTPPPPPVLRVVAAEARRAVLAVTHVASASGQEETAEYLARSSPDPIDLDGWNAAEPVAPAPAIGASGEETEWTLEGLSPGRDYHVALRGVGATGVLSPLSTVSFRTEEEDLAPPGAPGEPLLSWNADQSELALEWPAAADARVVGYFVYGETPLGAWIRLTDTPVAATRLVLPRPSPETLRAVAVRSVLADGSESALSPARSLWEEAWEIEGPFPHPVTDGCRIAVHLPADFPPQASLRVEVYSIDGAREAVLHDGPASAGLIRECRWDRRTERGGIAPPGFHRLVCQGGGRRTVRTIYLAP